MPAAVLLGPTSDYLLKIPFVHLMMEIIGGEDKDLLSLRRRGGPLDEDLLQTNLHPMDHSPKTKSRDAESFCLQQNDSGVQ